MTDAELIARLRDLGDHASFEPHMHHTAADRIEDLVGRNKELALQLLATQGQAAEAAEAAEAKLAECEARLRKAVKALNNAAIQLDWCQTAREISKEIDATLAEIKSGVATTPYGLEGESQ